MRHLTVFFRVIFAICFVLPTGFAFAAVPDAVTVPIQLRGTFLYLDVFVNDKPATFLLDTGAGVNVVTPAAAARLGLVAGKGRINAVGAGGTETGAVRTQFLSLVVGARVLMNQAAYILPLPEAAAVDGILGTSFLRNFVATIDYENKELILITPKAFKPLPGAASFSIRFKGETPFIEAKANGHKGWFRIDTGAGDAITVFPAFVDKQELRKNAPMGRRMPTGRGVGGLVYGEKVRLPLFEVGDFHWDKPVANFSQQTIGAFADTENAGNLGGDLWQRFIMTLDYGHNKVYLQPNALYNLPFRTSRSGMMIDTQNGIRTVIDVVPGSPASEAGIVKGDILLGVNGIPIVQVKPLDLSELLWSKPGTVVRLRILSVDKKERDVSLTLRDLI